MNTGWASCEPLPTIAKKVADNPALPADPGWVCDAVSVANQVGLLSLVSILLAVLGIGLGIFAVIGFGYIRFRSEQLAKERAGEIAEEIARDRVSALVPALVQDQVDFHMRSRGIPISEAETVADRIAEAFGEANDGEDG